MAKTRECCGALSLRRTGDDLHVSLHKGFKIRLAGIVPVSLEFTEKTPSPPKEQPTGFCPMTHCYRAKKAAGGIGAIFQSNAGNHLGKIGGKIRMPR